VPEILAEKESDASATKKMSVVVLPKYLICHRFEIKYNKHKYVHVLKAPHVSVLDGYLSPDF
jgi:ubiquitin C-terminal hydrolase